MRISAEDLCSLTTYTHLNMRPRIRSETMCYVLAGISKEASDFVRFKYAGDETKRNKVARALTDRVLRRQKKSKTLWKKVFNSPNYLMQLAYIAIDEADGDGLCNTCNGKGWLDTGVKRIDCFKCEGSGRRRTGDKAIADRLGCSIAVYRKEWKSIMERQMLGILASYEGDLYNAFRERL